MAFASLSAADKLDLACSLAVLLCHDGGVEVTGENLGKVLTAAAIEGNTYHTSLLAKALGGKSIDDMLLTPGSGGGGGGGGEAAPAAGGAAGGAKKEEKEEKKKEEEEEDAGGAGGLFGGDDDDW